MLVCVSGLCAKEKLLVGGIVCINQAENSEKSHQVRSMGRIYASARKVHVWLGPGTDEDADAVDILFDPSGSVRENWTAISGRHYRAFSDNLAPAIVSFERFVSRGWFTRRWVLQEICLGREVLVHCGDCEVRRSRFMNNAIAISQVH